MFRLRHVLTIVLASLACVSPSQAAEWRVAFSRDVLPILSDACFQCHGPDEEGRQGDLRLDEEENVKVDRGGYQVVAPGDAEASELLRRLTSTDEYEQMPPPELNRPLSKEQVDLVRRWIEQGAEWGRHWSFERVERPDAPEGVHPVDYFLDRRLKELGWTPTARADRRTLIRRLSLDLTGLPPTPEAVEVFLADAEPDAWARLVDRTLTSPAYGERMAWDWLDAARYADTNGYQGDAERTMWPWRDWVIEAFNRNLAFDDFTIWQLAGDLLPHATDEQVLATAFNRNHMINGEGGRIPEENRVDYVMDMTETTATVWLGLTLNCCRCHDHKFDPLKKTEYYQLTAFFNQTPVTGAGGDPQTPPVLRVVQEEDRERLEVSEQAASDALARLAAAEPEAWSSDDSEPEAEREFDESVRSAVEAAPADRNDEQWELLRDHFAEQHSAWAEALDAWQAARQTKQRLEAAQPRVMVMRDQAERRPTYVLDRGLYNQPGEEVAADVPAVMPALPKGTPADRLALAQWLVARDNPLTARVIVNRYWQMLFGVGLVKTAEDFGVQGERPLHPELLDWLAAEFMDSGWDVKHLLRTIATSEAYARESRIASPEVFDRDPDNRYLARGVRGRLPSWMIRDQALFVSGLLEERRGGPPVKPYQPGGVWSEATFGNKTYQRDEGDSLYRRSLYVFWRRIVGPTMFFDSAKRQVCEVRIARTNTPMHALAVLNDETYVEAARRLAATLLGEAAADAVRLQALGERVLCRPFTQEEVAVWQASLTKARETFAAAPEQADLLLAVGASPRDATHPAVEHAAWTAVCLNALNLDETLSKE